MKDCNALTNLLHILMPYALLPQALQVQRPKLTIYGGGGRAFSRLLRLVLNDCMNFAGYSPIDQSRSPPGYAPVNQFRSPPGRQAPPPHALHQVRNLGETVSTQGMHPPMSPGCRQVIRRPLFDVAV